MSMDYTKNKIVVDHFRAGINLFLTFQLRSSVEGAMACHFCKGQIQNILDFVDPNGTVTKTQCKSLEMEMNIFGYVSMKLYL